MFLTRRTEFVLDQTSARVMATCSPALARAPHTKRLFGVEKVIVKPFAAQLPSIDFVVGWGEKTTAQPARAFAERYGLPYVRAEDGFVRSAGLAVLGDPACSIVLDDRGIYYDATHPSRLENWLNDPSFFIGPTERARATLCIDRLRKGRLSKYNHSDQDLDIPSDGRPLVLVVDQTRGDLSVELGLVPENAFEDMVAVALREHPNACVLVKLHPDVIAGKKAGYLEHLSSEGRVRVIRHHVNPIALLERVSHVYVATSQLGFEALLMGKPVSCFGAPFYAGWGMTDDRVPIPRRRQRRTPQEVFAAAYFHYARYVSPLSGQRCQLEHLIDAIVAIRAGAAPYAAPAPQAPAGRVGSTVERLASLAFGGLFSRPSKPGAAPETRLKPKLHSA